MKSYVKTTFTTTLLILLACLNTQAFFPPPSCTPADKASAGAWPGNSSCGSPAINLSNTCTFEAPDPTGYPQIAAECDDYVAMQGQPDISRCHQVTVCGSFTAECDHMNFFQMATYSTCAGWVETASEVLYDAGCNPIQSTATIGGGPWTSLTPGNTYTYCLTYQMLDCNVLNSYLWSEHQPIPTPDFSATTACDGDPTDFTNQGTTGGGATFSWDFDGLGTSSAEDPSFTFPSDGTYNVTQQICRNGCCDEITLPVTVNPNPTASFTLGSPDPQCLVGNFFSFTNTGTTGGLTTYSWDYGDGGSSTGQNGSHSYATDGTFNVCLTTTLNGCTDQFCMNVEVDPSPALTTSPSDETCIGANDGSINLSVNGGPCGSCTYSWTRGLGIPVSTSEDLTNLTPDTYTVIVTDPSGCTATTAAVINAGGVPCACGVSVGFGINSDPQCVESNSYTFTNTGTSHGGTISVQWDFEDDGTFDASGNVAGTSYASSGSFTVRQRITDSSVPCFLESTQSVNLTEATAEAGPNQEVCQGASTNLFGSGGVNYSWGQIQGGGTVQNAGQASPTVTPSGSFPTVNEYHVRVTDGSGCTDMDTVQVTFNNLTVDAGPNLVGCRNNDLDVNGVYTNASVATVQGPSTTLSYSGGPNSVPNNDANGLQTSVNYPTAYTMIQEICVDITHRSANELAIVLEDPCGRTITLVDHQGAIGQRDFQGTCFDDAAAISINDPGANPPFIGTYIPDEPLSDLDSCPTAGNFNLYVIDDVDKTAGRTLIGSLNSWHITFAEMIGGGEPVQTWSSALYLNRTDTDTVVFNAAVKGEYRRYFTVEDDNCTVVDSVDILVCNCDLHTDSTAVKVGPVWGNTWIFDLSEPFHCDSVDAGDFDIVIGGGTGALCTGSFNVVTATPLGCAVDGYTGIDTSSQIQISISPSLPNDCNLRLVPSATNNIVNRCGNFFQRSDPGIILPIELLSLTGTSVDEGIYLSWVTASETDNDYFTVERSADGKSFTGIGRVDGAGNSTTEKQYHFTDISPLAGVNYYRIKQTDTDGDFTYSNVISVENLQTVSNFEIINITPIPAVDHLEVKFSSPTSDMVEMEMYDMVGRKVFYQPLSEVEIGINDVKLDISSVMESGVYYLIIKQNEQVLQSKILKY